MRMQGLLGRRSALASTPARRLGTGVDPHIWFYIAAFLLIAIAATGCTNINLPATQASLADARGTAVTFETIEGPPAQVAGRLMSDLNEEAAARQIAVVPRGGTPLYRIRGYLALDDEREPAIAWAWDVYDADQHRAFRLTGAEPMGAGRRGAGAWTATDEPTLRRIARASVEQLVAFIAAARAPGALAYAQSDD
jgi:hypothetical protein